LAVAANGGTLFLDEIEALDLECQADILRFVDQKEIKPLGSNKTEVVDIRLIVATNRDLGEMVVEGKFRDDLHSRLAGVVFEIPPLRERGTDEITKLAKFFYRSFKASHAKKRGFKDVRVPDSLWKALAAYPHHWPGNVRELKQVIESALFEGGGKAASFEEFVRHMRNDGKVPPKPARSVDAGIVQTVSMTSREERIVQFIRDRGKASRGEVETAFDLGGTAVWTVLKGLVNKGVILRDGNGRGSVYTLKSEKASVG